MAAVEEAPRKLHPTVLDTSAVRIARVYAQALHDAAEATGQLAAVIEEYESLVRDVLTKHPDVERMLGSGIINRVHKAAVIRSGFEGRASIILLNYLLVLNDHSRLPLLRPVLDELRAIRDQRLGIVPVHVQTAVPLDAHQEKELRDRLAALVAGQPVIHSHTDADLLGGIIIRVGDTVYDASIRSQLKRMREQLIQRSTHEIQSRRDQFSPPA